MHLALANWELIEFEQFELMAQNIIYTVFQTIATPLDGKPRKGFYHTGEELCR